MNVAQIAAVIAAVVAFLMAVTGNETEAAQVLAIASITLAVAGQSMPGRRL